MADLNPLKFSVAIQDDATKQLENIEQAFGKLKDKTITVKVNGLEDLQQLLSALQHQQVQDIGKNVGSAINEATKNLQKEAQDAIRTSLGNLAKDLVAVKEAIQHDNFTAFSTRITKCAEAVNTLDEAFKKFHVTIGQDEGMRNFMTGLGEVIRNVRNTMGMLNGGMQGASATPDAMARSVKVAQHETERLNNDLVRAQRTIETFGDKGFNVAALERYKTALIDVRENLRLIERNGGVHPLSGLTASQYLTSEDASRVVSLLKTELSYYKNIGNELDRISKIRSTLTSILSTNTTTAYRGDINNAIAGLDLREGLLARQGARDAMQSLNSEAYRQQITEAVSLISKVSAESRQSARDNAHLVESMRKAGIAVSDLAAKFDKLEIAKIRANAVDAKVDTTAYDKAVERMERYRRVLEYIAKNGGHDADRITQSVGYRNASNDLNIQAAALKALTKESNSAATATNQLSAEQQRLQQALETSTQKLHSQSQVLSDLKSLATQYLGVWGGQQFLNNIIQIGGQLEMQRLSIGAILQNQAQANDLFNKIKGLATQSPFGVVELDQMTKQLTAYGFKYNELFDMTKRLADISAATGTGVDRLALALGHVRSEAALSGYTLRQFAMGNVPMLQKLSEKLGKTTEEIRKMVRAKQISYDDVVGVLKDLTDEGGMFYNMQEVISQSVKAKFKNVRDAMDIMYGEMAEGSIGDALKEVADVLMDVTRNWKDAATVIGTGTAMWALHRVAVIANIAVLGQHNAATLKNIAAFRAQEVQQLKTASMYRVLSAAERQQIAISKQLTTAERLKLATGQSLSASRMRNLALGRQQQVMDLALALSSKKLTTEDIARQVALGKLSKAQARQILNLADLTAAERIAGIEAVNNTKRFGALRVVAATAANGIMRLATAFKSFVVAATPMVAISAIAELWMRNKQEMERAEELADKIREHSNSAMQATRGIMESSQMKFENANGKDVSPSQLDFQSIPTIKAKMEVEFDREEAQQLIDEWSNYIRQYSATPNKILNEALFNGDEERSLEEQFNNLLNIIGEVVKAQYGLHDMGDIFENATKATYGGWLNDDIVTNINDYENAVKDYNRAFADLYREHGRGVDKIVKSVEKENNAFATAVSGMGTYAEKFKYLIENMGDYKGAYDTARNSIQYDDQDLYSFLYDSQYGNFDEKGEKNWAKNNMNEDLETFFNHIEAELNNRGQKIGTLTKAQQQDLLLGFTQFLSSTKATSQETLDYLQKRFAERFQLELDVKDEKFKPKIDKIKKMLQDLSGSKWETELKFGSNVKDVIDEARKQYKAAKEYFEKVKPIMLKLGVEFEMGKELTQAEIDAAVAKAGANETDPAKKKAAQDFARQALQGVNEATRVYNQAMNASKTGGFSLEDDKRKDKGGSKAYKDEFAKRWDERIRIMKEAYSWYDKWEKKVGNDSAIEETNSKYGDIFKEWRTDKVLPMNFDVTKIADYQKYVEQIRDAALARYQKQKNDKNKKNGEEALRVYRQAVALLNDIKFDNFTRAAEQFKSSIEQTIDDLNTRWEVFNTVRNATGDKNLAMDVAGLSGAERSERNSADVLKNDIERRFHSLGGMTPLLNIEFDAHLDGEGVQDMFEKLVPKEAKSKIAGLVHAYKEWQKLQKNVLKEDIKNFSSLIGSAVSYEVQMKRIDNRLQQQQESNQALVGTKDENGNVITQEMADKANDIALAKANEERLKISSQYINFMNHSLSMTRNEIEAAGKAIEKSLNERLKQSLITAQDYASEMRKLHDTTQKVKEESFFGENTPFTAFMRGGLKGEQNWLGERIQTLNTKKNNEGLNEDETKELENYTKLQSKIDKAVAGLSSFSMALNVVTGVLDGFQKAAQSLSEMFEALGKSGAAATWGDIADGIGAVSGIFSPVNNIVGNAMSGNIGGVISSAISAPIDMIAGPITGFAKLHDKRLQREIEALQRNVAATEENTKAITTARKRTLGYDSGDLRRSYAEQYAPTQRDLSAYKGMWGYIIKGTTWGQGYDSEAQKAMYEYYKKNSAGSGYQQELANLKAEREDYMRMYDAEEDKKKSSGEALEEYKSKIAELDDQIRHFAEDIANELWSIDIKGWADQISDALITAFENGESAVKAFNDTAKSIMQSVASEMLKIGIIEPMMERLRDKLFGENGVTSTDKLAANPLAESKKVLAAIGEYFKPGGEGSNMVTAAQEYLYGINSLMEQMGYANGLRNNDFNSLSSSVQGTSEETSDLLAGYVNALRQDVAVKRILLNQFVMELWPAYIEQVTSIVRGVGNIDSNVLAIRMLLSENGAIYVMLDSMKSHLDNITNGNEQISVK